ncbi:hypothetical protein OPT61_g4989 [Boeremia exigua]|uniref:Uncharacterized protein n=1 Tax=Boeremia exigua TaxID=749465 RepID=A0ACC2IC23_9PLEO|nr:hypothetical protein OPT61_g4989 [Boeremia exigua]
MLFGGFFRPLFRLWCLLPSLVTAQEGCHGDTSIYNSNGLVVPFKNLCGKDIMKPVDFLDPTNERTWSDCLDRCVMKAPLCYGFDFTPYGTTAFSCWLMNATFSESDAIAQTRTVDAAMLSPEFLNSMSSDCKTLGLQGCFKKNGQINFLPTTTGTPSESSNRASRIFTITVLTTKNNGEVVAMTSTILIAVSTATDATTTFASNTNGLSTVTIVTVVSTATGPTTTFASNTNGLSTGAKAGIGIGVGATVLVIIVIAVVCVLKRRRRRKNLSEPLRYESGNKKMAQDDPSRQGMAELQAQHGGPYGSSELAGTAPSQTKIASSQQEQIYEIDGSTRYEK